MSADGADVRHPEDYCHRCDGPNISWFTPGAVWDPVMRPDGDGTWKWEEIICPPCFVELAGGGTWHLIPGKADGERWTSADERAVLVAGRDALRERVEALIDTWQRDDEESLNGFGQHLMGGAVLSCAEHLRAALDGTA